MSVVISFFQVSLAFCTKMRPLVYNYEALIMYLCTSNVHYLPLTALNCSRHQFQRTEPRPQHNLHKENRHRSRSYIQDINYSIFHHGHLNTETIHAPCTRITVQFKYIMHINVVLSKYIV